MKSVVGNVFRNFSIVRLRVLAGHRWVKLTGRALFVVSWDLVSFKCSNRTVDRIQR